jgi:hypothetical protein
MYQQTYYPCAVVNVLTHCFSVQGTRSVTTCTGAWPVKCVHIYDSLWKHSGCCAAYDYRSANASNSLYYRSNDRHQMHVLNGYACALMMLGRRQEAQPFMRQVGGERFSTQTDVHRATKSPVFCTTNIIKWRWGCCMHFEWHVIKAPVRLICCTIGFVVIRWTYNASLMPAVKWCFWKLKAQPTSYILINNYRVLYWNCRSFTVTPSVTRKKIV